MFKQRKLYRGLSVIFRHHRDPRVSCTQRYRDPPIRHDLDGLRREYRWPSIECLPNSAQAPQGITRALFVLRWDTTTRSVLNVQGERFPQGYLSLWASLKIPAQCRPATNIILRRFSAHIRQVILCNVSRTAKLRQNYFRWRNSFHGFNSCKF